MPLSGAAVVNMQESNHDGDNREDEIDEDTAVVRDGNNNVGIVHDDHDGKSVETAAVELKAQPWCRNSTPHCNPHFSPFHPSVTISVPLDLSCISIQTIKAV